MATLPTNYTDDVLDVSQNTNRKYTQTTNPDGSVSFTDVTVYQQQGTQFGAGDVNAQNTEINALNSRLTTSNNQQFRFGYDSTSDKYGYILESGGADTFVPFSSGSGGLYAMFSSVTTTSMQSISLEKGTYIAYGQTTAGTGSSYVNKNLIPVQYPIGDISVTNGTIEDSTDEQGNSCSLITMSSDGSLNFRAYSWGSGQGATAIAIIKIA